MISIGSESLQRDRVDCFRPNESLHVFQIAVSRNLGAGAGTQQPLGPCTVGLEFAEAFSIEVFLVNVICCFVAEDGLFPMDSCGEIGFRFVLRHRFLKRRIEQHVDTTEELAGDGCH